MSAERQSQQGALTSRPLIGLTLMLDLPERDTHLPRFGMNRAYFDAIRRAGGVPVSLVPGDADEMSLYVGDEAPLALDGICLAAGGDLHPSYFGREMHPKCDEPEPERDAMEMTLLRLLRDSSVPIFAICRGIQVLNAAWGGTIIQDIAAERPDALRHDYMKGTPRDFIAHDVRVAPGTLLHEILGTTELGVNSIHHQAVDAAGEGLIVSAVSPDGIIEGLEPADRSRFLIAVQFHPEDLPKNERMQHLFTAFVDASAAYHRKRLA